MYQSEFFRLIKKRLPRAILLFGENSFQIERVIEFYIEQTKSRDSLAKYYFDEYNFNSIKSYLSQNSLFGESNFLLIKRDKKVPKSELKLIVDLTLKQESSYFIFYFLGNYSDIKTHLDIFNRDGAVWVRFFKPSFDETILLLEERARELSLGINRDSIVKLINLLEGDLSLAINELEKLSILEREVTSEDIDSLIYSTTPLKMEDFLIKLFRGENIVLILKKLLEFGEDEFFIIRSIQNFLNQILSFKLYINLYNRVDSRDILGYKLPIEIERQRVELSSLLSFETLSKVYEELIDIELQLKNTNAITKEVLLYTGLIRLQRIIR